MAVIQISRIQVRRGQKNQGSGIPQLAGGEIGWSMDSQELFIGNGSVAEGAPQVGNTKVLTEHDNLFELADEYIYKANTILTGDSETTPIRRTLQDRLDDIVTVRSFGATGDGSDQSVQLQRAIDQIFLNDSSKGDELSRTVLYIPAGVYNVSRSIKVPPFANIVGAGIGKTKIVGTGNHKVFETVNLTSTPNNYSDDSNSTRNNQPQKIRLEGLTIDSLGTSSHLLLQSCRDSIFRDIELTGYWESGDDTNNTYGIELRSLSEAVGSHNNLFTNIILTGLDKAIGSDFDVFDNKFDFLKVTTCGYGIVFGENTTIGATGQDTGPSRNIIENSLFSEIDKQAIWVQEGVSNLSKSNKFLSVGNVGGTESNAQYSVIKFVSKNNRTEDDYFSRTEDLGYNQNFILNDPYVSEIEGPTFAKMSNNHQLEIGQRNTPITLFRLPGDSNKTFTIEYVYNSTVVDATRVGKMTIMMDSTSDNLHFVDDYDYNGDSNYSSGMTITPELADVNNGGTNDTILVKVKNTTAGDQGTFNFAISTNQH